MALLVHFKSGTYIDHGVFQPTYDKLEWCNPWPHVVNHHISINQLLSLWRHSLWRHSLISRVRRSQPPFSLYRHSLIVMSFATEMATPTVTDVRAYVCTYVRTPYRV